MSHWQVGKSFLETLSISKNPVALKMIVEEFFDGRNGSQLQKEEGQKIIDDIKEKILLYYGADEITPFPLVSGQNCSDLIIQVGEILFLLNPTQFGGILLLAHRYQCSL